MDLSHIIHLSEVGGKQSNISLADLFARSRYTILYFYPKDNTPGCTLEWRDFTQLIPEFDTLGVQVVGVSRDPHDSHVKFQSQCGIGIDLIADDGVLVEAFAVMGEKNMYGKIIFGLLRSTFLLDASGGVLQDWRNVRAKWHAERVLQECRARLSV